MNVLAWLNPYRWLLLAALAAAVVIGVPLAKHHYDNALRDEGRAEVRAEYTAAALRESQTNAKETQRRLDRQKEAEDAYQTQITTARADAVRADDAARRMQQRVAELVAAGRRSAGNPAPAGGGQAADDPIGVLADVLSRADARAGVLARFADEAHSAGALCERTYDALTTTPSKP